MTMKEDVAESVFRAGKDSGSGMPLLVIAILIMSLLAAFVKHKGDEYKDNGTVKAIVGISFLTAVILLVLGIINFLSK